MSSSAQAAQPSYIFIPDNVSSQLTVVDFLIQQFPHVSAETWHQRIKQSKIHWQDNSSLNLDTLCRPRQRVYYYREVQQETKVPFTERILFENDRFLIVFKPHFLPVTPSGNYVNECLVHRLRIKTGIETIAPAHRLDKDTAGLMLFTKLPECRNTYHSLFKDGNIHKQYQAIAKLTPEARSEFTQRGQQHWEIKDKLVRGEPSFLVKQTSGEANTHSKIRLIQVKGDYGLFELEPITGKTHQLRVHMLGLGMPILNDRFYPELQPKSEPTFENPLNLLAQKLAFTDPIDQQNHVFTCSALTLD
ncbi:pseudouridine synthase [Shewanella sp. 202IG2-18]|uniref:pseudouridine synthase n=1 Tax=Parashewanella hymeniacidonis TaxID=2807618 RepID=UPI0019611390|nr:pseudouridine synthase [Parashewanella hymeniacidonis]MBM7071146.1 pseudouridine synthase [Parashewanella hymeniacidonis]